MKDLLTTIHNSPVMPLCLESMVAMAQLDISNEFMRRFIAYIDLIIQKFTFPGWNKKAFHQHAGNYGYGRNVITMQEIFHSDMCYG
ncbi:MAG: hypothetical protein SRB2_00750 [Desulfobacteraceae bacterium Eth-SRB2]|nr:MAG: hypothetical protein SRB2_00750 [Desulfobacteraceae bacterium Eth-SRB2]